MLATTTPELEQETNPWTSAAIRPSSSCTGMWTVISLAALLSTLQIPSSSRNRAAA